ncbi:MAG: DEAD/DEAH box helicase [Candidatus Helarchaeota archaeon]
MMDQLGRDKKPQNIFLIADHLQDVYKRFVKTFQKFQNPIIQNWVNEQMERENLLYKEPIIELNFQFKKGKSLHKLVQEGVLNSQIPSIFDIEPYSHQSEAIEKVCKENKNIIVSTGTGSGKSICFWVPIVNTCLEMKSQGLGGIKAIVIFPMNALANSQYNIIVKKIKGTGLTIGKFTGDTPYSKEEGIRVLEKNQKRAPYDCELVSREEIRKNPPNILITNYVMLDLILTRHEDKVLFPEKYKGYLKYLVLDEIHTYTGNTGADVACLIRRVKEKTKSQGKIRCIGTSATIQDDKMEGVASIIEFAGKVFGEEFDTESLIEASYVDQEIPENEKLSLPATINIKDSDLKEFDGQFRTVIPIAEKLLGRPLNTNERTERNLGELFKRHPTIIFLKNILKENSRSIKELTKEYKDQLRNNETFENCLKELKAALLLGTVARISIENEERPLIVPKIHLFFTQGHEISSCITKNGPHPSIKGDLRCKECNNPSFPLYFCRNCGHEFYSVIVGEEQILPRVYETEEEGELVYLTPITKENSSWNLPEQWLNNKGELRKTYIDSVPIRTSYCPKCNRIDTLCSCQEKIEVWKIPYPFQICPSCEIFYTKKRAEYGKLFTFNSTGRSSATDILATEILKLLSKEQKKIIIFTDSRQDTALQAEHMNEFKRRLNFRQIFYHVLKYIQENRLRITDKEIGNTIFQFLVDNDLVPDYQKENEDEFSSAPPPEREFKEFLTFLALSDIMQSQYFLDLNLDKLGLLKIKYDGLEDLIKHNIMINVPKFSEISEDERYDYIRGLLDVFRWNGAIGNIIFNDTVNKFEAWQNKLKEEILFDINKAHWNIIGFSFEKPQNDRKIYLNRQNVIFKKITGYNTILVNWTKKFFKIDKSEEANAILQDAINILIKSKFLVEFYTKRPTYKLYQIREGKIIFELNTKDHYIKCPKCNRTYNFKKFDSCIWRNCPSLIRYDINYSHYYLELYQELPDKESEIHAREHSAQIEGSLREEFENEFLKVEPGTINVLVCTPTMELGIDIGDLSAIIMRNVPPDPSRYAQRSGRAGRKNQPSIIAVFCGSGIAKGPHDQYFYEQPEKIVSGKIIPPNFLLDNKKLIRRHIHATIFENLKLKVPQKIGEILNLDDIKNNFPYNLDFKNNLLNEINNNFELLKNSIIRIFDKEIGEFSWFNNEFIHSTITNFYSNLDEIFNIIRDEFSTIIAELEYLHNITLSKGRDQITSRKYGALARKLEEMRSGKKPYFTFNILSNYGFLPNYAFPSESTHLAMYDSNKLKYHDNWRSAVIAIKEFAPHNQVYFLGNKYNVNRAMIKTDQGEINVNKIYVCDNCNEILIDTKNRSSIAFVNCPNCKKQINLSEYKSCIHFPAMSSISGPRITCDEENRKITGYKITMNYKRNIENSILYNISYKDSIICTLTYEHNGKIYLINKGTLMRSKTSTKTTLRPFNYCSACNKWLYESDVENHIEKCEKNGGERNLYKDLELFVEGNHDVIVFNFPVIETYNKEQIVSYYKTLKETIIQSLILTYNLDESEINGFINPLPDSENMEQSIVIFETQEGGSGVLKSLLNPATTRFNKFIKNMKDIIHIKSFEPYEEFKDACVSACYNCLLRFKNQFEHKYLNRKLIIPLIKRLVESTLSKSMENHTDSERLDELKEKCDSELEKKVLDEIIKQKFPLPSEVQKTIYEGDVPIVQIDFFYRPATCVFVDGPPHMQENIKRQDKEKREFLEAHGYIVIELDFRNGEYVNNPSLIEREVSKLNDYL